MQTKDKVRFYRTPDSVLQRQLLVYDEAADKKAAENPMFKEIAASQRQFAARAVKWDLDTNVARRMAYNHYFAKRRPGGEGEAKKSYPSVTCPANHASHLVRQRMAGFFVFYDCSSADSND